MNPDLDMQEAARLIERARDLLLLHRDTTPGLAYFFRALTADAAALRNMARIARQNDACVTERLFA